MTTLKNESTEALLRQRATYEKWANNPFASNDMVRRALQDLRRIDRELTARGVNDV